MDQITTQSTIDSVALDAIASFVQAELIAKPRLAGTILDLSALVGPGMASIKVPAFNSFVAERKYGATELTAQSLTESGATLELNKNDAVYTVIEQIAQLQSSVNMQEFYGRRIASALRKKWDAEIYAALDNVSTSNPDHQVAWAAGSALTKADFTNSRKLLREAEVDIDDGDLFLAINPTSEAVILGLSDFVDADKWGSGAEQAKANGIIGRAYGFNIVVSSQFTHPIFYHRSACAFAIQQDINFMQAPSPKHLGVELAGWHIYGCKEMQSGKAAVKIITGG